MPIYKVNPFNRKRSTLPHKFDGLAIPPPAKKAKPTKRAKTPEAMIQQQVESYLRLRGLAFFHIPDALLKAGFSHGAVINGALINAAAAVRGFPDLLVFDSNRQGECLALELKTNIGTMTSNQKDWQRVLGTKLCRGFDEAKTQIDEWANNKRKDAQ